MFPWGLLNAVHCYLKPPVFGSDCCMGMLFLFFFFFFTADDMTKVA